MTKKNETACMHLHNDLLTALHTSLNQYSSIKTGRHRIQVSQQLKPHIKAKSDN